ncbi:MAG: hypothetical protein WCP66_05745 [Methylococcales bacterium]
MKAVNCRLVSRQQNHLAQTRSNVFEQKISRRSIQENLVGYQLNKLQNSAYAYKPLMESKLTSFVAWRSKPLMESKLTSFVAWRSDSVSQAFPAHPVGLRYR